MCDKVLIIAYYFPPYPNIASVRLAGLAKYLQRAGIEPVVVTPDHGGEVNAPYKVVRTFFPGDVYDLILEKIGITSTHAMRDNVENRLSTMGKKNMLVEKIIGFAKGIIAYPDSKKTWIPHAIKASAELIEKEGIKLVISSSPPATTHLIAKQLKDRFGVKWIADLRDLWTQHHYRSYGPLRKCFEKQLELKTLSTADVLVTVSAPLAKELGFLHGRSDVSVIQNGYDPEEIGRSELTKEFTITYTGRFHEGKHDPDLLLRALKELKETGRIDPSVVRVRFFGSPRQWVEKEIAEYGLGSMVKQYGNIPRDEVIPKQRESQVLFLMLWDDPRDKGVYTGKVFEYLAAGRPILAVGGPEGVVTDLLKKTNAGVHVHDLETLKERLLEYYGEYVSRGSVGYDGKKEEISKFSHPEMAGRFVKLIERLTR